MKTFFRQITLIGCFVLLFSCLNNKTYNFPEPEIKAITTRITGKIIYDHQGTGQQAPVKGFLTVNNPITLETIRHEVITDTTGQFSLDVQFQSTSAIYGFFSDVNLYQTVYIGIKTGKDNTVTIIYDNDKNIKSVEVDNNIGFTQSDMIYADEIMARMIEYRSARKREVLYDKDTDYYLAFAKKILNERLELVQKDSLITDAMKEYLTNEYTLFLYKAHVFDYVEAVSNNYLNINKEVIPDSLLIIPGREYYYFLKELNLGNPKYLYSFMFPEIQKELLSNSTLNIPRIGDTSINEWQTVVKQSISDLLGFSSGQYYDILTTNAYSLQFVNELEPLSGTQIENIHAYFKGNEFEKILLRKNEEIEQDAATKSELVVNELPDVPDKDLFDAIIAKYKGKVVLIDFWATWCAPCLDAMRRMKKIKSQLEKEEVVFVYFTNTSSPEKLWNEKIKGIGGEHYYITNGEQWDLFMEKFDFGGIPAYVICDKQGMVKEQFVGYPGNDEMLKKLMLY